MGLNDFQVFNEMTYSALQETLAYNIALFNQATRGALTLISADNMGDYTDQTFYARIADLVRRRNVYANSAVAEKELAMLLETSVKVAAGTPPVRIDKAWFDWINRDQDEAGAAYGQQMAVDMIEDMLSTAVISLVAALVAQPNNYVDDSANSMSYATQLSAARKFGDRADSIRVWIMHSKTMFDIWGDNLANGEGLFSFGNVTVRTDPFGRPIIVADLPGLYNQTDDTYYTLGLQANAALVEQNDDFNQNVDIRNGFENIRSTIQSEWSYNVSVKGFGWDKTNGGHSPTDAALASSGNWDKKATSNKDLAGVLVETK